MADNYTQFSVVLPLPKGDAAVERAKQWALSVGEEEERLQDDGEDDQWYEQFGGTLVGFECRHVWIHSDESGNVEAAANLIQRYLRDMDMEGGVYMGWADTCSKPRDNEFSGGGVVVTKDDQVWVNSYDACRQAGEAGVEILNAWQYSPSHPT